MAKFDEAKRAYEARRETSGLNAVLQLNDELSIARLDAEDPVMQAQPRTLAGVAALLVFAAEYWERKGIEDYPDFRPL